MSNMKNTVTATTTAVNAVPVGTVVEGTVFRKLSTKAEGDKPSEAIGVLMSFAVDGKKHDGLCHVSQLDRLERDDREARFAALKPGDKFQVKVIESGTKEGKSSVRLSGRALLLDTQRAALVPDAVFTGVVKSLARKTPDAKFPYGVFVQLIPGRDGQDGLVHCTELVGGDRTAQNKRLDSLKVGDSLTVAIKEVSGSGRKVRVSLSESLAVKLAAEAKQKAAQAQVAARGAERLATLEAGDAVLYATVTGDTADGLNVLVDGCVPAFLADADTYAPKTSVRRVGTSLKVKVATVDRESGRVTVTRQGLKK